MELVPIVTSSPNASNSPNAILSEIDDKLHNLLNK